jgi:NTP pyrophosphatase (non-canonical NTP hydrolase)
MSDLMYAKTNFQKTAVWNVKFGVLKSLNLVPNLHILRTDPDEVESCMKLIREEMRELEDGVNNHNFVETIDALADLLFVIYGMGARLGVDMDKAFNLVYKSNLSKACRTQEDLKATLKYYDSTNKPTFRLIRGPQGQDWYIVYDTETKKVLKSLSYTPVDISKCL